jgi:N utilization substance protein B
MLNRRHLRVRVLQSLYAYETSEIKEVQKYEKSLLNSVEQVYIMYLWTLNLLEEVADYALIDADERANKYIPDEEDLKVNTKLATNTFIESLRHNEEYLQGVDKFKISWSFDPEIARGIFIQLRGSNEYVAYLASDDRSIAAEKDIIKFIFKKIILSLPIVDQAFEEKFLNWAIDKEVLKALIAKTLKNFSSEVPSMNQLASISPNWNEDREFALELLGSSIRYKTDYQALIGDKTKNWEAERIALIDTLLMRMAICELLHFPSIPVKVTMNEYIDIAKEFSTPKSNTFINGILDKILADLKNDGRIRKNERGMKE